MLERQAVSLDAASQQRSMMVWNLMAKWVFLKLKMVLQGLTSHRAHEDRKCWATTTTLCYAPDDNDDGHIFWGSSGKQYGRCTMS